MWGGVRAEGCVRWAGGARRRLLEERHGAAELMREGSGCEGALFRSKFARWHRLREANPALYEGAAAHQAMRDRAWRDGGALDQRRRWRRCGVSAIARGCGSGSSVVAPTMSTRRRRRAGGVVERTTSEEGEPGEATPAAVVAAGAAAGLESTKGARCSTFGS